MTNDELLMQVALGKLSPELETAAYRRLVMEEFWNAEKDEKLRETMRQFFLMKSNWLERRWASRQDSELKGFETRFDQLKADAANMTKAQRRRAERDLFWRARNAR